MPDFLSQVSLPVLGLILVGIMAVLAVVRGVFRLFRTMLTLAIGFAAGTLVFLHAPDWLHGVAPDLSGKWSTALGIVGGAIGHFTSGFALDRVLGGIDTAHAAGQDIPKGRAVLLSLLPSGLLIWLGGVLVRLSGSLSGMAHIDQGTAHGSPWLARASESLSQGAIGRFFELTDPVTSAEQARLCEILVSYRESGRWKTVSHDPRLQAVLSHPKFQRLLNDREVKRAVAFSNHPRLLTLREVREAAQDPTLAKALRSLPEPEVRRAQQVQ